jgi:hypothetical protein
VTASWNFHDPNEASKFSRLRLVHYRDILAIAEPGVHRNSKSSSPLTESDIDTAFRNYVAGGLGNVHREIREFVGHESFAKIARGDDAEEKIKNLIYKYSPSLKADGSVGEL